MFNKNKNLAYTNSIADCSAGVLLDWKNYIRHQAYRHGKKWRIIIIATACLRKG